MAWTWWRLQMETFSALLAICVGNSPVPGEFPAQRPVTWSFDVFFDLRLNKRLSKQLWGWRFETPWWSLWRQCNELFPYFYIGAVVSCGIVVASSTVFEYTYTTANMDYSDLCAIQLQNMFEIFLVEIQYLCRLWYNHNTLRQRQNGCHFPDNIFKWISWMKMYEFRLTFHWIFFLRVHLTIFQHWFR